MAIPKILLEKYNLHKKDYATNKTASFYQIPIGDIFEIQGWPYLYVKTVRESGYNAEEYDERHYTNVPSDAKVKHYARIGQPKPL